MDYIHINLIDGIAFTFHVRLHLFYYKMFYLAKMAKYHIFWKFLAKKHCFGNKWQSTTFSRTRVSETRVPHQFCHRGTVELEFVRLKKIMWYSSLVNSSTMCWGPKFHNKAHSIKKNKEGPIRVARRIDIEALYMFKFLAKKTIKKSSKIQWKNWAGIPRGSGSSGRAA